MKALIFLSMILLSACGSQLRAPFCKQSIEIPERFFGKYEYVLLSPSAELSGQMVTRTLRFEIGKRRALVSDVTIFNPLVGKMCEVGGHYYMETRNSNGTYGVSEVLRTSDPSGSGRGMLVVANLMIDLDRVRQLDFPFHYLPVGVNLSQKKDPLEGVTAAFSNRFILDNTRLTPELVLSVAKPFAWQTVFRSLPGDAPIKARGVVEYAEDGWRLR